MNALETAERDFPETIKIRQHRLGEAEDDSEEDNTRADADERSAKRRKVENSIDDAGSEDGGSDPDGNPWHVGVDNDDEDSDIDSDEAFGESDEERFADFTFRGSESKDTSNRSQTRPKPTRQARLTLEEQNSEGSEAEEDASDVGDDEEEDDLGEDAVDLTAAWDMDDEDERAELSRKEKKKSSKQKSAPAVDSSELSAESASEESENDSEQSQQSDVEVTDDEPDENTTLRLRSFVDGLTPAERASRPQKSISATRALPEKPSPYALTSTPISAADLLQYVKDPTQRQSLKILQAAERETPSNPKDGIPGKLAAPLAKRQQDRLDRVAAYDQSKQALDKWVDTVKQNRRAEHLSFPLADPTKDSASAVKAFQPLSKSVVQSELESKISEIMRESGLGDSTRNDIENDEQKYEELKEKSIPLEEVQARRRELRMQRELMFREEIRAKRIKKIKSKAYRRVHRKERDKFAVQERERLAAAGVLDSDEEREKNDRRRAEERMGARHRESKWAKAAKATGQTTWNEDAKQGVSELARRDDELRRRIEGKNIHGSDDSGSEGDSESIYDSDSANEDARWMEKLDKIDAEPRSTGKSKLADMAFMKKAEAERKAANDQELRDLRQDLRGEDRGDSDSGSDDAPARQKFGKQSTKTSAPARQPVQREEFEEALSEDETPLEQIEDAPIPEKHSNIAAGTSKQAIKTNKPEASRNNATKPAQHALTTQSALDDYTSPSESEGEGDLDDKDKLALDIFAGDDEVDLRKQFQKEKKQAVKDEGDRVIDNTLPGWGNWTGAGLSKKEQKKGKDRFMTTIKGIAPEARRDAKLDRVIVNEKRIKKNGKYLATELPHPFESRQQYERSLRLPMGPEWSTRNHFQDSIKPRVLVKQGHVIKPMSRPVAS